MKSITIHGLDHSLDEMIRDRAKKNGLSLNKTIKRLLEEALGVVPKEIEEKKLEFADLCGIWEPEDLEEFENSTQEFNQIDEKDWL